MSNQEPIRAIKHGNRISLRLTDDELATLASWAEDYIVKEEGERRRVTARDIAEQVLIAVTMTLAGPPPWE